MKCMEYCKTKSFVLHTLTKISYKCIWIPEDKKEIIDRTKVNLAYRYYSVNEDTRSATTYNVTGHNTIDYVKNESMQIITNESVQIIETESVQTIPVSHALEFHKFSTVTSHEITKVKMNSHIIIASRAFMNVTMSFTHLSFLHFTITGAMIWNVKNIS